MPYTLRETTHPGVWSLVYESRIGLEDRLGAIAAVRAVVESQDVAGVLIDFRGVEMHTSREHAYELARERAESWGFLGVRRAFLYDRLTDEAEFDALVSQNRAQWVRAFVDEDAALSWLIDP